MIKNTNKSFEKKAREKYQNLSREEKDKRHRRPKTYQNLSEEEKEKKCQYHCNYNKNLSEEQKQKQVEFRRNYLAQKK